MRSDVVALRDYRNTVQTSLSAPRHCAAHERRTDPSATRLLCNGDQSDRTASLVVVGMHADVALRRPDLVGNEHHPRPPLAAASNPNVVQVVAPIARKSRIRVEPGVRVAYSGNGSKGVDIALAVLANGVVFFTDRPLELDSNIHELESGGLSRADLVDLVGVNQKVEARDAVGMRPGIRLLDCAGRAADANSPEL